MDECVVGWLAAYHTVLREELEKRVLVGTES